MGSNNFIFTVSSYDESALFGQVIRALEKRTELVSREKYPKMWNHTDRIGKRAESRVRSKVLSVLCLLLGIFLFVPGLAKPQELLVPLLVGAIAIGAGIGGLVRGRKQKKDPFEKSAKLLINSASKAQGSKVFFYDAGMKLDAEVIPYSAFEFVIETAEIYALFHDTRVSVLQKKDLADNTNDEFRAFIKEKTSDCYHFIGE